MKSLQHALLLALCFCFSISLLAQQPKTKTKTESGKTKTKTEANKTKTDTTGLTMQGTGGGTGDQLYPYTATYSSQFTIGNPEHGRMILTLWKDWDDNNLDRNAAWIADTITMETSNGMVVRGKDSVMVGAKQYRGQYTTVKSTVEAWMPLRSTDRNENWVAIWGSEQSTTTDGKVTTNRLHEIWRINRDGKVDFIRQFTAKPPVQ